MIQNNLRPCRNHPTKGKSTNKMTYFLLVHFYANKNTTSLIINVTIIYKIRIFCCCYLEHTYHSFRVRAAAAKTSEDCGYIWLYIWGWGCIWVRSLGQWAGTDAGRTGTIWGFTIWGIAGLCGCCRGCSEKCSRCSFSALSWYLLTRANASFVKSRQRCRGRGWRACNIQFTQACFSSLLWLIAASTFAVKSTVCLSVLSSRSMIAVSKSFFLCFFLVGARVTEEEGSLSSSSSSAGTCPSWDPCGRCTMCLLRKPKFVSTHFCLAVRLDLFWPLFFFWTLPRMVRWDL